MTTFKGVNEWDKEYSIVEERQGKCLINIPKWGLPQSEGVVLDDKLGLIAILLLHDIQCDLTSKKTLVFTFEYDKKHTDKILRIEKAYFSGKVQVDAKQMSKAIMTVVNYLLNKSKKKVKKW